MGTGDRLDEQINFVEVTHPVTTEWRDKEWTNQEWTQLSLKGLSRAYSDDEPGYEILEIYNDV